MAAQARAAAPSKAAKAAKAPKAAGPAKVHKISAKALAADRANLAKARAAGAKKPRSAKQIAASRANLSKARAAQQARRSGKTPVSRAKKATAPMDSGVLHALPACAPVALAGHLRFWTGTAVPDAEILALHRELGGGALITDAFELATARGLCGWRPASWARCGTGSPVTGLLYGLALREGYHAVLAQPGGMLSWGMILPWPGSPDESWHLEWVRA